MLAPADIAAGTAGALALLRGDKNAMRHFDVSFEGFWRSFFAIVLIVPVVLLYIHGEWLALTDAAPQTGDPLAPQPSYALFVAKRLAATLLDWLAYPLLVLALARPLSIEARAVPYIVAQNWAGALASAVLALPGIAFGFGFVAGPAAGMMTLVLFAFALRYFYLVARIALDAPPQLAAGLVALNAVLSLVLSQLVARVL